MKGLLIVILSVACLAFPQIAQAIEGLPGSAWGELHQEFPSPGDNDTILEGWIKQGIGWKRWEGGRRSFLLNTYVTARYKWDSEGFDWNNYLAPGVGISIDVYAPAGPVMSLGAEYIYQMNYRSANAEPYTALFTNWYHWWDIRHNKFPGSTWGDLRWEVPNSGHSDVILDGWIRQGLELKRWQSGRNTFVLNPFLRIRYKWDSEGLDWNNYVGPGAGIGVDMDSAKGPLLSWGIEYGWEKNLQSGDDIHRVNIFMRWYAWWDLKR